MSRERAVQIAIVLAIIALGIFIIERVWQFGQTLGTILSTVLGAWLLSLIMRPFISYLCSRIVPVFIIRGVRVRYGELPARRIARWRLPFGVAVAMVYSLALILVTGIATVGVATFIPQLTDVFARLPGIATRLPAMLADASASIALRFGLDATGITQYLSSQYLATTAGQIVSSVAGQAVAIAAGTASLIAQIVLMLILSLYITVEKRLLVRQFFALLPVRQHEEVRTVMDAINHAFDGYLRGFILGSVLRGLVTIVIFGLFGLNFGIVVALIYGLLSIIPLIGSPVGILVAALVALVSRPDAALPVALVLFIFDQVVAYVILPRIMSDTIGVPGLVGLLAISIGVQLFGFWGLIFGVPVMGAIYSLVFDYYLPRHRKAAGLPELDQELQNYIRPHLRTQPLKPKDQAQKMEPTSSPSRNPSSQQP